MSIEYINNDPQMVKLWHDNEKTLAEQYYKSTPNSVIPFFMEELKNLGFDFETSNQALGLMPKNKEIILPVAIKYYQLAREKHIDNEQNYFISFLHFRGLEEAVPMLLEDYHSKATESLTRWFISDCLYQIKSKKYVDEYIEIASNPSFGINRQMIILLLGKLKVVDAIPVLVDLLEDEEVRLQAISALGEFKREDLRCYFERFQHSTHPGWRKYAKKAIKKLDEKQ